MIRGAIGARLARGNRRRIDRRRVADAGYALCCLLLLAGGAWFRLSVPLWPLIEPDTWNYLWPALSAIERGVFTHAGARAFPYPLFLWAVLEASGDFRAIAAAQYALGMGTALLGLLGWHAACRLIDPRGAWWIGHRLGGLFVLFALLFYLPAAGFERSILPEALFTFAISLAVALTLAALASCRDRARDRGRGATLLLGAALLANLACVAIKPHFLLALPAAFLAAALASHAAGWSWRRRVAAMLVPAVLFALGFWLPERRLAEAHDAFASRLFLPQTLFCWHLGAIRPWLLAQAPGASEKQRALIAAVDAVLTEEVFAGPGWYADLGYDADKCMYGRIGSVVGQHVAGDAEAMPRFYLDAVAGGIVASPGLYAAKVGRELRAALALPLPVDQYPFPAPMAATLGRSLAGHSAAFDRYVDALARSVEPPRRKLQSLTRLFYRPLERVVNLAYVPLVGLALIVAVVVAPRWSWRVAPVLTLAAMQLGIQLTIAMSHSHAVIRYRAAQYPLTILLLAVAAMTLLVAAAELRRRDGKPESQA